jgi:hypothetical protein
MDAVSASQTAMDAVSASQTAMDAVSASQTARGAINSSLTARSEYLLSGFVLDTLWSREVAASDFWTSEWSPQLPYNNGYMDGGVVTDSDVANKLGASDDAIPRPSTIEGEAAYYQEAVGADGTEEGLSLSFDLTDAQALDVTTYFYWLDFADTDSTMFIKADGTKIFELANGTDNQHTFTDRTFDVSGFSGETTIELGITSFNSEFHVGLFTKLRLR